MSVSPGLESVDHQRGPRREACRLARFLGVGVLNTAFGYAVFYAVLAAGAAPVAALAIATIIGVAFNFVSTGSLVFDSTDARRLGRFIAVYGAAFAINAAALSALIALGLQAALAQALLVVPMALLAFILNRRFVFGDIP